VGEKVQGRRYREVLRRDPRVVAEWLRAYGFEPWPPVAKTWGRHSSWMRYGVTNHVYSRAAAVLALLDEGAILPPEVSETRGQMAGDLL
jgi:hypothetical protein